MAQILDNGKTFPLESLPATGLELLASTSFSRDKNIVALLADGSLMDLHTPLPSNLQQVEWVRAKSEQGVDVMRHSTAHILAQAVKKLYPEAQVTIGPVIENGFFYDFSKKGGFKEEELPAIEEEMQKIIKAAHPIRREVWSVPKAIEFFKAQGEAYKCEIISDLERDQGVKDVSVYWQGDFVDLCRGPHLPTTGHVGAFKLSHVAGAYWRGSEKNEMLSRIYGLAFASQDDLKKYLHQIEEAKKRDHRRIGTDLGLFSFHPEAPASPFFHPNGARLFVELQDFLRALNLANGFEDVITPLIMSQELWKASGHYDNYKENMYFTDIDDRDFAVKPMNCPGHCLIFRNTRHSYRELPMRLAEFGRVHRHERSGVTQGLFRVRSFVQDDAHIYCTEDQIESEILNVLKMVKYFYTAFDFTYHVELSTRPEKRIGSEATWDKAENALKNALQAAGESFKLNPGDGAFYGPKIDFHLRDSLGRTHQCGTIQLDFSMPARFGLEYLGGDNAAHTPVMIHRAIAGSLERFLGILIEHYAGHFPFWMAPSQIAVLSVSQEALPFCESVYRQLREAGYRVQMDLTNDKLSGKIKKYQSQKIPYLVIIGAKEAESQTLSLRLKGGEQKSGISVLDLLGDLKKLSRPDPLSVSAQS